MNKFQTYLRLTLSLGALGTLVLPYSQNLLAQTQVQSPSSTKKANVKFDKVIINSDGTNRVITSDEASNAKVIIYSAEHDGSANGSTKTSNSNVMIIDSNGVHTFNGQQSLPEDVKKLVDDAVKNIDKDASVEIISTEESSKDGSSHSTSVSSSASANSSATRGGIGRTHRTVTISRGGSQSASTEVSISENETSTSSAVGGSSNNSGKQRTCCITARGLSPERMSVLRNSLATKLKNIGTLQSLAELPQLQGLSDELKEKLKNIRINLDDKDSAISVDINGLENLEKGEKTIQSVKILLKEADKESVTGENTNNDNTQDAVSVVTTEKNNGKETKRVVLKFRGNMPNPPTPPTPPTLPTPPTPPTPPSPAAEPNSAMLSSSKLNELRLKELSIYPNPSDDGQFTLRYGLENDAPVAMRITNIEGREILSEQNLSSSAERIIDLSAQGSGTYLVTLTQVGKSATLKLVVSE